MGPPIFTLAIVSNACVKRPLYFPRGLIELELSVISPLGTETISKELMKANELFKGLKVITRISEVTFMEYSFTRGVFFGLKFWRRT